MNSSKWESSPNRGEKTKYLSCHPPVPTWVSWSTHLADDISAHLGHTSSAGTVHLARIWEIWPSTPHKKAFFSSGYMDMGSESSVIWLICTKGMISYLKDMVFLAEIILIRSQANQHFFNGEYEGNSSVFWMWEILVGSLSAYLLFGQGCWKRRDFGPPPNAHLNRN